VRWRSGAVITSTDGKLNVEVPSPTSATRVPEALVAVAGSVRTDAQIRQLEAGNIRAALKVAHGKVSSLGGAAQLLGLKPTTLASRIKRWESSPQTTARRTEPGRPAPITHSHFFC
jgi:transcriptional regulator with GAF, ATPase, and Fis domain